MTIKKPNIKIILFDIDKTLLDTDKMAADMNSSLIKILGSDNQGLLLDLNNENNEYMNSLKHDWEFNPKDFVKHIIMKGGCFQSNLLLDVFYGGVNVYKKNLFPDTLPMLKKLHNKYKLGICS